MDGRLKMQDTTMERPKLFVSGMPNYMFIINKAIEVAKANDMDYKTITAELMEAGALNGRKILGKYFEVV